MRTIPGYTRYLVNSKGRIWDSTKRRFLKQTKALTGKRQYYFLVTVHRDDGKYSTVRVHKLVALAFYGVPNNLKQKSVIRHLDGDSLNNAPGNLRWGTYKENEEDKEKHGRVIRGSKQWCAVLDEIQVRHIKKLLSIGGSHREIANQFQVHRSTITAISCGKSWCHVSLDVIERKKY